MFFIDKKDEIDQLRQLATYFDADVVEMYNSARLDFENSHGKGFISTYKMFSGLVAQTFNIHLYKEFKFSRVEPSIAPAYFIYCVDGYYLHRFNNEDSFQKVNYNQNVILKGGAKGVSEIILPPNIDLKITIISLKVNKLLEIDETKARRLDIGLKELVNEFTLNENDRYFGEIDLTTSKFAKVLVNIRRVDSVGVIIREGAILNTLGSQLANYEEHKRKLGPKTFSKKDLDRVIELGEYIKENIDRKINIEELSSESGLSPKKLQECFNYLYGESVAQLIQRLRMEHARHFIQTTNLSISEISYKIGIASRSYFSKLFREHFGSMPSEYRLKSEMPGMVYELSYKSTALPNLKVEDINSILATAQQHNSAHRITGALVYYQGTFFQLLEGNRQDLLELYQRIENDRRHTDVQLLYTGMKSRRTFNDWSMAFLGDNESFETIHMNSNISFVNMKPIMVGMYDHEVFTDILWRRILNILKSRSKDASLVD